MLDVTHLSSLGALLQVCIRNDTENIRKNAEEVMSATTKLLDVSAVRAALLEKMGESATGNFPEGIAQRFPHILARIADLWGSAALDAYLDSLMLDDRDGRQGFPPDVATEIFRLISTHAALGLTREKNGFGWSDAEDPELEKKSLLKGA